MCLQWELLQNWNGIITDFNAHEVRAWQSNQAARAFKKPSLVTNSNIEIWCAGFRPTFCTEPELNVRLSSRENSSGSRTVLLTLR